MTDLAVPDDRIDEAKAEEARLREKLSDEELAAVGASLTRSLVQLRVNDGVAADLDPERS